MSLDLAAVRTTTVDIARQAAEVLLNHFDRPLSHATKQNQFDIVTEADRESETLIVNALREAYPEHYIVGEEGAAIGTATTAEYHWYIDPLDGTVNFASGIPIFAVSIAMTDAKRQPLVGVVYNPVTDELFSAASGQGVTLNDKPIHVSNTETLAQSVLASGFPYARDQETNLPEWGRFSLITRGLRRMGAAAIDVCYVAAGRFDGYWEQQVKPWDYLAGVACVLEAGGTVTDYTGDTSPDIYQKGRIVASNGIIHQQMLDMLSHPTE